MREPPFKKHKFFLFNLSIRFKRNWKSNRRCVRLYSELADKIHEIKLNLKIPLNETRSDRQIIFSQFLMGYMLSF